MSDEPINDITDSLPPGGRDFSRTHDISRRRRLMTAAAIVGCVAVVIVVTGLIGRAHDAAMVKKWTSSEAIPAVSLVTPKGPTKGASLVLPGTLQAFYSAPIYARVAGYVHAWYHDIGAQVKTGELLATIDTPELDQQLIQARADLASTEADMKLADITSQRWSRLLVQDAVSKQEADEKAGDFASKTAKVNASKANVERLVALKSFARIVAPFDGVVTARKTDIGDLVNVGASATTGSELFDVSKVNQLRLYVRVPQNYSSQIRPGVNTTLNVPEYPGKTFPAVLTTTSNSVSNTSGTLLVELLVDNADHLLKDGDYAQVKFALPSAASSGSTVLVLPSSALLFRKSGMQAAVVGPDNRVHLHSVTVGRDLGTTIEISSGLDPTNRVINNPPDSIADGQLVRVIRPEPEQQSGSRNADG
jgi:RND family efflux transporter MFP subunit